MHTSMDRDKHSVKLLAEIKDKRQFSEFFKGKDNLQINKLTLFLYFNSAFGRFLGMGGRNWLELFNFVFSIVVL